MTEELVEARVAAVEGRMNDFETRTDSWKEVLVDIRDDQRTMSARMDSIDGSWSE